MSKMQETIKELRDAAASINAAADWLYRQFSGGSNQEAPKLEDVRAVLAGKSRAGHTAEIRALLKKYGAEKLSAVDPANYGALLKDAEVLGSGS